MNDFEFLRNLPFGQYLSLDTPLERIDCRARIISYVLILAALTLSGNLIGLLFGLVMILISMVAFRFPLRFALRGLLSPLPFLLILAILQVFINPGPDAGARFIPDLEQCDNHIGSIDRHQSPDPVQCPDSWIDHCESDTFHLRDHTWHGKSFNTPEMDSTAGPRSGGGHSSITAFPPSVGAGCGTDRQSPGLPWGSLAKRQRGSIKQGEVIHSIALAIISHRFTAR